jgi:hypothetical protein
MCLAVLGGKGLDDLEGWVRDLFSRVKGGHCGPAPTFEAEGFPFEVRGPAARGSSTPRAAPPRCCSDGTAGCPPARVAGRDGRTGRCSPKPIDFGSLDACFVPCRPQGPWLLVSPLPLCSGIDAVALHRQPTPPHPLETDPAPLGPPAAHRLGRQGAPRGRRPLADLAVDDLAPADRAWLIWPWLIRPWLIWPWQIWLGLIAQSSLPVLPSACTRRALFAGRTLG